MQLLWQVSREQFSQIRTYPSGKSAVTEYEVNDLLSYALSLNLHRRHLTASQRATLAAEIASLDLGANQHGEDQNQSGCGSGG